MLLWVGTAWLPGWQRLCTQAGAPVTSAFVSKARSQAALSKALMSRPAGVLPEC